MMDLYSEIYDRFFRHDHNRKKNVPDSLKNVLADNFMIVDIDMDNRIVTIYIHVVYICVIQHNRLVAVAVVE